MKRVITSFSLIILIGISLELGGYFYGLQISDIIYYHIKFKNDMNMIEKNYKLSFNTNISKKDYPTYWKDGGLENNYTEPLNNKYSQARFFICD